MPSSQRYPSGLVALFFVEMWERFSYYGMRAILILFLVDQVQNGGLGLATAEAAAIYGLYTAAAYILALPGGWVADRFWGYKRAIVVGGIAIMLGHILLAISGSVAAVFFLGLVSIAIGTGLLKPNISTLVGQLYDKNDIGGRDAGFSFFYMGINVGAILGGLIAGYLGEKWGWHWGFGAAAVAMLIGLVNFLYAGNRSLRDKGGVPAVHHHPDATTGRRDQIFTGLIGGLVVVLVAAAAVTGMIDLTSASGLARAMGLIIVTVAVGFFLNIYFAGDLTAPEKRRMIGLAILFVAAALFWSGFEQAGSSLNLFANDLTRRELGGFIVPASWFQNLNSLFIILLTPVFAAFWIYAEQRWTIPVFVKFGAGLVFLGLGFLVLAPAAQTAATGVRVSALFLIATYFLHTVGELMLSPVGLSTFSRLAPERFTSQMMGFWFVASSLGNLMAGLLAAGMDTERATGLHDAFLRIFMTSAGFGLVLILLARPLTRWVLGGTERVEEGAPAQ
ncbi:peptide MFS transporter [Mycoplana dimorpha]|uniref:POT family proton-dependent oligopeptide transporter n=1 Tax=Mycoplana dimorpha TaxID=28320 RepID=A0A2T5B5X0_MYCDI|nr:peptide MFS transporter [Mycoplana dimorpha]PTM94391.1 POT family proton-dependent oligopeptide transporter [Mycoplana dimorpha]